MPSLFRRLIVLIASVLAFGAVILGAAAWIYARIAADEAYDRLLVGAALQIAESVSTEPGRVTVDPPISAFETLALAVDDRIFYRVLDPRGEVLTGQGDLAPAERSRREGREPVLADAVHRGFPVRVVTLTRPVFGPDVSGMVEVTVAQTLSARLALAKDLTIKALLLVLGMSALALFAVVVAVRHALRPLEKAQAALKAREPKDLRPLDVVAPREIQGFIDAINHFLSQLADRISRMERFIADTAHQIRTPLTALAAQIDLLSAETRADQRRVQLGRVRERSDQLGRLTNQLLNHAMVIHRRDVVPMQPVDLVVLARIALSEAVPLSLGRDIRVSSNAPAALHVPGDAVSIREAIVNVIHNAVRYGAPSALAVEIVEADGEGIVMIEDDGPGIPRENWEEAIRPFSRLGDHRHVDGSGLGLAIAADVMQAHDGKLVFGFTEGGAFRVSLHFPQMQAGSEQEGGDAKAG